MGSLEEQERSTQVGRGEGTIEVKGEGEKKKTMQVGMTEKRGGGEREEEKKKKKEDARSVLRTPALLNEVVPRCLRSSLKRLPPASLRC